MKQEYTHKRNHFGNYVYLLAVCLSEEIYIEKIKLLQENRLGLWDVLENCERKGSLDVHKKSKENDFQSLFRVSSHSKIILTGKESHRYFIKKID
jgi:hypoxanthine-DNA glycosylase